LRPSDSSDVVTKNLTGVPYVPEPDRGQTCGPKTGPRAPTPHGVASASTRTARLPELPASSPGE
jgi:hypothetical protein